MPDDPKTASLNPLFKAGLELQEILGKKINKMSNHKITTLQIIAFLESNNIKGAVVSINRIADLKNHIENFYHQNLFDEAFYQRYIPDFNFNISKILPDAQSIIIATVSQPILNVEFCYKDRIYKTIVPPTYVRTTNQQAFELLANFLEPGGFKLAKAKLPEKLLLASGGIAKYGKNNIAYVEGMGSFHRPSVMVTDARLEETKWIQPEMHERCTNCQACLKSCPTGAITADHFLLKAEKCLTYHNESDAPFPEWIKSAWHNCLIGCMICQNVCPLNRDYLNNIEDIVKFTEPETLQIISNTPRPELSPITHKKLVEINLYNDYHLLSRNLNALLKLKN